MEFPASVTVGKARERSNGVASAVRYVRQSSHSGALVARGKVRVLARDCRAFVPYDLARDKVGNAAAFSIVTALSRNE